ncbi:hypothetical protein COO60DRAFT_1703798 [Scenedesmus sp. NREL 46B-D3]|nr:hypothetical protein COO60DRAFT_1703798 [Scenedesmus sp. NREL 46B-D3]
MIFNVHIQRSAAYNRPALAFLTHAPAVSRVPGLRVQPGHAQAAARLHAVQKVPSTEAAVLLERGLRYLDVRTPEEYADGHAVGAVNIPLLFKSPEGQMTPNPDFLQQVQQAFPDKAEEIIVGCRSGGRSARATSLLEQELQYAALIDDTGGWLAWVEAKLPTTNTGCPEAAYSVVPAATAPSVAAAATRAAAKTAAIAAAAADSANSSGGLPAVLPRAEQCVPRQFWGLMNEELRPWHKQVLVRLCFCLPRPACYVYRDMRAGTMQGVLAQRAMLEKAVRAGLVELEWQARRLRGWLDVVSREDAHGCVAPESLRQAQQELADLKASLGATRSQLAALQGKARTYSDTDYAEYASRFEALLLEMQALADVLRQQQAPLVHRMQDAQEAAARRALFAPTSAAAAAAQAEAAAAVGAELSRAGPMCRDTARRLSSMRQEMQQQLAWRYPPREYVLWRFKGRPGASRPPLSMPGLKRAAPAVRQAVQQLPRPSRSEWSDQ